MLPLHLYVNTIKASIVRIVPLVLWVLWVFESIVAEEPSMG